MDSDKNTITCPEPVIPLTGFDTLPDYLLHKAEEFSSQGKSYYVIDAITREKRYFSQFSSETGKIASALHKLGLRKGDIVIYMPRDVIRLHIFLCGVWRANGICRASYPDENNDTIVARLKEASSKLILCDPDRAQDCLDAASQLPWKVNVVTTVKHPGYLSIDSILEEDGSEIPELEISGEDVAFIMNTSGTTGPPKGAMLTHRVIVEQINLYTYLPWTEDKPNIIFCAGTHYSGSLCVFILLVTGKIGIVAESISKELVFKTVHDMKPGLVFAFPAFLLALVGPEAEGYDMTSVEVVLTQGAIVKPAIRDALLKLPNCKDIANDYGMTEAAVVATTTIMSNNRATPTYRDTPDFSVGKPYPGTYVQIRDPQTLEILGPGEQGEICVKDNFQFKTYFSNPSAREKMYIGDFIRTGDIGYFDEQGFLYMVDRLKEIFKYYNNHISPSELEAVIESHPLVETACVIGIPDSGGGGDIPRAFVTLRGNHQHHNDIAEDIKNFTDSKLANYKQLRGGLYVVRELPKGKSGKISRALAKEIEVAGGANRFREKIM